MAHQWDQWSDFVTLQGQLNELIENTVCPGRDVGPGETERAGWTPASDVYENETEFVIVIDLPGIEREALDVSVNEHRLLVRGDRPAEPGARQRGGTRPAGSFLCQFGPLPGIVDQVAIVAEYKDGVLRLRLPKQRTGAKEGRVQINIQ